MPGITLSAGYGAGGSVVGPLLAQRLGYPLLDRAISSQVAEQLHVTVEEARGGAVKRSLVERFFGTLAPLTGGVLGVDSAGVPEAPLPADDTDRFRAQAEDIIRTALPGGVVILGRAGAAMLVDEPNVLRVRLFGPTEARTRQAARLLQIDQETATRQLPEVDNARASYVRRLYDRDIDDSALYHLQVDTTRLPFETCVDVIATAYSAFA